MIITSKNRDIVERLCALAKQRMKDNKFFWVNDKGQRVLYPLPGDIVWQLYTSGVVPVNGRLTYSQFSDILDSLVSMKLLEEEATAC